jgi:hypothetical protein
VASFSRPPPALPRGITLLADAVVLSGIDLKLEIDGDYPTLPHRYLSETALSLCQKNCGAATNWSIRD